MLKLTGLIGKADGAALAKRRGGSRLSAPHIEEALSFIAMSNKMQNPSQDLEVCHVGYILWNYKADGFILCEFDRLFTNKAYFKYLFIIPAPLLLLINMQKP